MEHEGLFLSSPVKWANQMAPLLQSSTPKSQLKHGYPIEFYENSRDWQATLSVNAVSGWAHKIPTRDCFVRKAR